MPKEVRVKDAVPVERQYVNEHILATLMASFKNYDGATIKERRRDPEQKAKRAEYEILKANYHAAMKATKKDKRSQQVREAFKALLAASVDIVPSDAEIAELYAYIREICRRCIGLYGRNRGIDFEDMAIISFERVMKYSYNFDPFRRSKITNARVNAFSYLTQMIKNNIFEESNRVKKREDFEKSLAEGWEVLFESTVPGEIEGNVSDYAIIQHLTNEIQNFTDLGKLMREVSTKYDIDSASIIQVINVYHLKSHLEEVLNLNRWEF